MRCREPSAIPSRQSSSSSRLSESGWAVAERIAGVVERALVDPQRLRVERVAVLVDEHVQELVHRLGPMGRKKNPAPKRGDLLHLVIEPFTRRRLRREPRARPPVAVGVIPAGLPPAVLLHDGAALQAGQRASPPRAAPTLAGRAAPASTTS